MPSRAFEEFPHDPFPQDVLPAKQTCTLRLEVLQSSDLPEHLNYSVTCCLDIVAPSVCAKQQLQLDIVFRSHQVAQLNPADYQISRLNRRI